MQYALLVHLTAAVIWIGGMFFAYLCLRPAAAQLLEPPTRLSLWSTTLSRFFPWVWGAVVALPVTGLWMVAQMGGFGAVGVYVHIKLTLGIVMILIYLYVFFLPYRRLRQALAGGDVPAAGAQLNRIRILVGTNLAIGLLILVTVRLLRGA